MRNRLAWIGGALGGAALVGRELWRRRNSAPEPEQADPRAEELRRKLDESRSLVTERDEFEAAETPVDEAQAAAPLEERRLNVHARGRAAVERMREREGSRDPS